ncbi:Gx transporter family protein [Acidaminobacterium chupaoyuni]
MNRTKKIALCGILAALALALSLFENLIPLQAVLPLPGIKLGLANIITLMALYLMGGKWAAAVLFCRIAALYLATGNLTSLAMSLTGGCAALIAMLLAYRFRRSFFSIYGVSILGAAMHNVGQIAMASLLMRSLYTFYYLPVLLILSLFTGFLIAFITDISLPKLKSAVFS